MTKPKSKPKAATRLTVRKDRQARVSQAIGASIIQTSSKTRYQARPHHRDATDVYGRTIAAIMTATCSCQTRTAPQKSKPNIPTIWPPQPNRFSANPSEW
jgi:hypothetical protein